MLDSEYKEELENGKVLLFSRNGIFQARVYQGSRKYLYRSLKTRDVADARRLALKFLYEIEFKQEQNLPLKYKTFNDVIDEYVHSRQREYERAQLVVINSTTQQQTSIHMLRQIKRVVKFWREYCGKMPVDRIDNAVLQDYVGWRKDYYHRKDPADIPRNAKLNPADKTLEWEIILAKTLLKFAHERGYRGKAALPTYRFKSTNKIVRPAFTPPEYTQVYKRMRKWIYETDNDEWRYTRLLLRDYVLILSNSGMRVGEANNLKESDVIEFKDDLGRKNYMFNVKGKTGKRTVIPRATIVRYVERALQRNAKWKAKWAQDADVASRSTDAVQQKNAERRAQGVQENWFFRMADGCQVISLIDQFNVLLKSINLTKNRYGEKYTLYSLRHFYAVRMLTRGHVGVFDIARNMGTSVQIIEQYYGKQATPMTLAAKLGA